MKKPNKILSTLMVMMVTFTMLYVDCGIVNAEETVEGTIGNYYTYSLDLYSGELALNCIADTSSSTRIEVEEDLRKSSLIEYSNNVKKISLMDNFKPMGNQLEALFPFYYFSQLEEIIVSDNNQYYTSLDGVLFNKDKTILYCYPMQKTGDYYEIPESVTVIGYSDEAMSPFEYVCYLNTVNIPKSTLIVFSHSFVNMQIGDGNSITNFIVDEENPNYKSIDGVLFSKDSKELIAYPSNKRNANYIIPTNVEKIGVAAFSLTRNLRNVTIPEGVDSIDRRAFYGMWNYDGKITIPASVKEIGIDAFGWLGSHVTPANVIDFKNGTALKEFPVAAFSYCGEVTINIPCNLNWDLEDVDDKFTFNQTHSFTEYVYNNDAKVGVDGTETAVCDYGCDATDTRTKAGTALSGGGSSGGGGYIPPIIVQKPTISTGDGYTVSTGSDGTTAAIDVQDGYKLVDVAVNDVSKGEVTTLTGLKTGDKVEVKVVKKEELSEAEKVQAELSTVTADNFKARSKQVKLKNGKKAVKITWSNTSGVKLDGIEVFRSVKRNSGYGTKPVFSTEKDVYYNTAIKKGTKYYYKVRGYVKVDGIKYYTDWSAKAWRTTK